MTDDPNDLLIDFILFLEKNELLDLSICPREEMIQSILAEYWESYQ